MISVLSSPRAASYLSLRRRPTEEAHQAKKDADKEGTKAAYQHKEKMIDVSQGLG